MSARKPKDVDEEPWTRRSTRQRASDGPARGGRMAAARDGVGTHGDAGSGGGVRADAFASAMPTGWGAPAMTPTSMAKNPRGSEAKR